MDGEEGVERRTDSLNGVDASQIASREGVWRIKLTAIGSVSCSSLYVKWPTASLV